MRNGHKLIVHGEELGDRIVGIMGGYIRWSGLVEDSTKAITLTERLTGRQLDPFARDVIMTAPSFAPAAVRSRRHSQRSLLRVDRAVARDGEQRHRVDRRLVGRPGRSSKCRW